MRKLLLLGSVVLAAASAGNAETASADGFLERPTVEQGHVIAHLMLDRYAEGFDGKVVVGRCEARRTLSLVCVARITGRRPDRIEVVATTSLHDFYVVLRAAPMGRAGTAA